ncbi:hypothetical protein GRJ2_001936500 [Grus japonensis]|uniref:Uncharacterized protein n=1 Tax=Grus japonensis TaxID=30415 RepID=A0ABC9XDB2_GRUJA
MGEEEEEEEEKERCFMGFKRKLMRKVRLSTTLNLTTLQDELSSGQMDTIAIEDDWIIELKANGEFIYSVDTRVTIQRSQWNSNSHG